MKVKTADLIGPALDWAVAQLEFVEVEYINDGITRSLLRVSPFTGMYRPSTDWSQGGPIIEQEWIELGAYHDQWRAVFHGEDSSIYQDGPTPLIAAMRCYVASRLDEVDVPKAIVKNIA